MSHHNDTVCIYSGGMDSFTLMSEMYYGHRLHSCLSFNYGQRHAKELVYAQRVCAEYGVPHTVVDLHQLSAVIPASALTGNLPVPQGHYAEESMKQTVVPNRNMIMLAIAAGYAMSHKVPRVAFGAHAGDHTIYPDCRKPFVWAFNTAVMIGNWDQVEIIAPYLEMNKADILHVGFQFDLDYGKSWTCYEGRERACGKCGACQERLEAFAYHNVKDPLEYANA